MKILLIDDSTTQRRMIASLLQARGYSEIVQAASAVEAYQMLGTDQVAATSVFDLILIDLYMPEISGLEAISRIKRQENLKDIPIIMITGSDETTDLQAAFNAGAMDYITKPPNPVELIARVRSALQLKHETDQRKEREASLRKVLAELGLRNQQLEAERSRSESLLLNILPPSIVTRLKRGESIIADGYPEATVLFADVVGFTKLSTEILPIELITLLNTLFSLFDYAAEKNGVEKIKTMGDAYIAVGGVPIPRTDHIEATVNMALEVREGLNRLGNYLLLRMGIHTGPVVAGVIGTKKFIYDLWGDTVNVASRLQSTCEPSEIHVSEEIHNRLCDRYNFIERGFTLVRGKGEIRTYLLVGKK